MLTSDINRVYRLLHYWLRLRNEINTLINQKSYIYTCGLQYQQSEDYGYYSLLKIYEIDEEQQNQVAIFSGSLLQIPAETVEKL